MGKHPPPRDADVTIGASVVAQRVATIGKLAVATPQAANRISYLMRACRRKRPLSFRSPSRGSHDYRCSNLMKDLSVTEAIDEVIVHHSNRLHECINDRRADKAESPVFEILAECLGFGRSRGNLSRSSPAVEFGPSADEPPAVGVKVPELFLDLEKRACVANRGLDLHPVAYDLRIMYKPLDLSLGKARDFLGIEFVERATITFPLFQHQRPVQSGLRA
jgi:hypothetical protein